MKNKGYYVGQGHSRS